MFNDMKRVDMISFQGNRQGSVCIRSETSKKIEKMIWLFLALCGTTIITTTRGDETDGKRISAFDRRAS